MHAQTVDAAEWWARPRGETAATWISNYQNSLKARHRTVISHIVGELRPATVLELGSHCGPNLVRLAQDYPSISRLTGVDVNAQAIERGEAWIKTLGLEDRIELVCRQMPAATENLPDGCVDVVLSCYALAYIAPPDRDAMLYEMGRLAKTAVILAEPMTDEAQSRNHTALNGYMEWAHNYHAASRWIGTWSDMRYGITMIEPPVDHLDRVLVAARTVNTP